MPCTPKKYYWLKLKDSFFSDKRIKKLRRLENGDTLVLIYLKIQLVAMKQEGVLHFNGLEETFAEELALEIDEDPRKVLLTLQFLSSCSLMEAKDEREFFFTQVVENTGRESSSAPRVRSFRSRKKERETDNALQCNTEKEIETEKETEKEKESEQEPETEKEELTVPEGTVCRSADDRRVLQAWNSLGLQQLVKVTGNSKRGQMLHARIREYGMDAVLAAIEKIRLSPFLKGQNTKGWMITFDWFVRPNNFPKVLEGNYDEARSFEGPKTSNPFLAMLLEDDSE